MVRHDEEGRSTTLTDDVARRWTVRSLQPIHYDVEVISGVLDLDNLRLVDFRTDGRRLAVVDESVATIYGARIHAYLERNTTEYRVLVLPGGEVNKTDAALNQIFEAYESFGLRRRSEPVIAIGGGVLMDTVAFASSIYRRSTPCIKVPTTLIGIADAGIGVKTGVNWSRHKNRIGSYDAPSAVLLDTSFLNTLHQRHISNGLAEILKIALIKDKRLFSLLEQEGPGLLLPAMDWARPSQNQSAVIQRAITGMLDELEPNLRESVLERRVDYGHTFSPVIEMTALPALLHGEAVAIDMIISTVLAERRGLISSHERQRVVALTQHLRLPLSTRVLTSELLDRALADATAHRDGLQRTPLPVGIGDCTFVDDISAVELSDALGVVLSMAKSGGAAA
jgi:3-dehydroquinate synthetase